MGVSKEVDMVFTRRFDTSRLQVMVMDPSLIPQRVNVVIGEGLYELSFKVEWASSESSAQLMDTDAFHGQGGSGLKDARSSKPANLPPPQTWNKEGVGKCVAGGVGDRGSGHGGGHKVATFLLNVHAIVPVEVNAAATMSANEAGVVGDLSGVFVAGPDFVSN
jgi:hypothetical protein